ncbi:MAG: hypothetical protein H5T69_06165 [Chloroflexi bacterium]|nr:hypothetical protein [Chloroflexota bacterium]
MKKLSPMFWGVLLIVVGALALLQTLGIVNLALTVLWALVFAAGGGAFLYVYGANRAHWWALIPGMTLLAIAVVVLLSATAPEAEEAWGGTVVVGAIALSFFAIYGARREFWWALIPGGVMVSVALTTLVEALGAPIDVGFIVLLGIGVTFLLLSFIRTQEGERLRWALIPGAIMTLIGFVVAAEQVALVQYVVPAALVALGLYFVLRSVRVGE